jgi:hypothetical protein
MQTEHFTFPRMTKAAAKLVVDNVRSIENSGVCYITIAPHKKPAYTYRVAWNPRINVTLVYLVVDPSNYLGEQIKLARYSSFDRTLTIETEQTAALKNIYAHLLTICETA